MVNVWVVNVWGVGGCGVGGTRRLTSTLLKSIIDERVLKVPSSRTRGRITSFTYPMRYV